MIQYSQRSLTSSHMRSLGLLAGLLLCAATLARAAEPLATDTISNTPLNETWRLLTTANGYRELGIEAAIDLRIGGATRIDAGAGLPPIADILAYDPERMLALGHYRASAQSPAETPLWTVI